MVMALGAFELQSQKHRSNRAGDFVQEHCSTLFLQILIRNILPTQYKTGRNRREQIVRVQLVTGNLLTHKLIEREIQVEGVDHPVTIFPRQRARLVIFIAIAFGKPCQVEPMLGPPYAVRG